MILIFQPRIITAQQFLQYNAEFWQMMNAIYALGEVSGPWFMKHAFRQTKELMDMTKQRINAQQECQVFYLAAVR